MKVNLDSITVAYEPIWAIGSGLNAEKDYIEETHEFIKKYINDDLGWSQSRYLSCSSLRR